MKKIIALACLLSSSAYLAAATPAATSAEPCAWYDREVTISPKIFAHHLYATKNDIQKIVLMVMQGELTMPSYSSPEFHINEREAGIAYNDGYEHGIACLDESQQKEVDEVITGKKIMLAALIKRFSTCIGNGSCKSCEKDVIKYAGALDKILGLPHPKTIVIDHASVSEEEKDATIEAFMAYAYAHLLPIKK